MNATSDGPRPTDEQWDKALDDHRETGWNGDESAEWERRFWEAGFRQGVAAARESAQDPSWEYEYADDDDPEGAVYGQVRRIVGPWEPVES
jgi:hypothetical protein